MREQDPRVPPEVEEYIVGRFAALGQMGGEIGRGRRGGRGGGRGAALGARQQKTMVQEREAQVAGTPEDVRERITDDIPELLTMPAARGEWRIVVPYGRTGLKEVVVDLALTAVEGDGPLRTDVRLLAFCKEGIINRGPTARMADRLLAVARG